jgi:hypothetical protein
MAAMAARLAAAMDGANEGMNVGRAEAWSGVSSARVPGPAAWMVSSMTSLSHVDDAIRNHHDVILQNSGVMVLSGGAWPGGGRGTAGCATHRDCGPSPESGGGMMDR